MNIKELIGKFTVDGEVDYEQAEADFQKHVNGIVTKNVKKEVGKKEAEVMTSFINELGIEATDLEGIKKWVGVMNDNSTDFQKQNGSLQAELDKALNFNKGLQTEYSTFKQDTLISGLNVKGEEAEFLKYKFNKNVSDDITFESQIEEYKKANRITTGTQVNNNFNDGNTSEPLEAFKKLRGN